jgi:hypothetical protein
VGARELQPYAPRPIRCHGLSDLAGFRTKDYSVVYGPDAVDWVDFARGFALVAATLPSPAVAVGRPGVGFRIAHQGATGRYAVVAWWANENELPIRLAVRRAAGEWRLALDEESICVWDLQILAFERDAYVETVLAGGSPDEYLQRRFAAG